MPKIHVRGDKLTVTIPKEIRDEIDAYDGEEIDIRTEDGRIVLTPKEDVAERQGLGGPRGAMAVQPPRRLDPR